MSAPASLTIAIVREAQPETSKDMEPNKAILMHSKPMFVCLLVGDCATYAYRVIVKQTEQKYMHCSVET